MIYNVLYTQPDGFEDVIEVYACDMEAAEYYATELLCQMFQQSWRLLAIRTRSGLTYC